MIFGPNYTPQCLTTCILIVIVNLLSLKSLSEQKFHLFSAILRQMIFLFIWIGFVYALSDFSSILFLLIE